MKRQAKRKSSQRRGAAAVLIVFLMGAMIMLAGYTVNLAYHQSLKTQHKVAVDAASKAAVEALLRTEDTSQAIAAAKSIANKHKVGSQSFDLADSDIVFGRSEEAAGGGFTFTANQTPFNAIRILGDISNNGATSPVPMVFGNLGHSDYSGTAPSTSAFLINEVMLCLDRSGSMKFDMTGTTWSYPADNPHVNSSDFWDNYYGKPHPTDSRWAVLRSAITAFFDEAEKTAAPPRVALTTWSSSDNSAGLSTVNYALPSSGIAFSTNESGIQSALDSLSNGTSSSGVFGGTYMHDGMLAALNAMDNSNSHDYASKSMIVLTDGEYSGSDPIAVGNLAADRGIKIHCVSLLAGSTFTKAQQIAQATGGDAYMATDSATLISAFEEIAKSMDVVLTE